MNSQLARRYAPILVSLAVYLVVLGFTIERPPVVAAKGGGRELIQPIVALVVLTGVVWVLMFLYRNVAVARRAASLRYYKGYMSDVPPEWVERPARAFMNLLEVPVLFYLVCVLMLQAGWWDSVQLSLAWLFVATRYLHAAVYIALNDVPLRFAAYAMGVITVTVMWWRFAAASI